MISKLSTPIATQRGHQYSRRQMLAAGAAAASTVGAARAQDSTADTGDSANADFLFVQTANGMAFASSENRLTLRGVSPVTLFFSDRPERIAGNMQTTAFIPFWAKGTDSFAAAPPNADLSVLEDGNLGQTVVVLRDPAIDGENLHYTVEVIGGRMPVLGRNASLFIDIIVMPRTPLSYAGVDRRAFRRATVY